MICRALVVASLLVAAPAVAPAVRAQPVEAAPVDPYATSEPAKPVKPVKPVKPAKPAKGKKAPPPAPTPAAPAPLDPYAAPTAPAPRAPDAAPGPKDPYAAPGPKDPYAARGPKDPDTVGASPAPASRPPPPPPPATTPPAPVDPYAAPAPTGRPAPTSPPAPVDPYATPTAATTATGRIDVAAVQGLLAVQALDGWLLTDHGGGNPIAQSLVEITGAASRRWFYLVPRTGEPTLVVHGAEVASFAAVPGRRVTYVSHRELAATLKKVLKGRRTIAMEYSPKGELPSLSRVDAGTVELVRAAGVTVKPSHVLVQFAKASWGPEGRKAHYLAAHHLTELRKDALAFLAERLRTGVAVTEREVVDRLVRGMATRGLIGPPPVVAFGRNTADPTYAPGPGRDATLARGELVLLGLAGKVDGGIYAATTWVAVADAIVSPRVAELFAATTGARDAVLELIRDRLKRRRAIAGWEVDRAANTSLMISGQIDLALHRTGHSLDTDLFGSGTDLDDTEVRDPRALVVGSGFTVGPGLYVAGQLGVRTEISAYLGKDGLEITTPAQTKLELLLGE